MKQYYLSQLVNQPQGFRAFIPSSFPLATDIKLSKETVQKHTEAIRLLGKLDGITELLPDKDCFLQMFILKDAHITIYQRAT
ncbi:hypothetical protein FWF74_00450 [Candidatus Saccharibacteria bacterium]|nr:hypothetical protein [Candidatus Saccharibacteria bacterium]MCL1963317.1 hypothetical protein [Candidatus Saccharibacteria bacterium]